MRRPPTSRRTCCDRCSGCGTTSGSSTASGRSGRRTTTTPRPSTTSSAVSTSSPVRVTSQRWMMSSGWGFRWKSDSWLLSLEIVGRSRSCLIHPMLHRLLGPYCSVRFGMSSIICRDLRAELFRGSNKPGKLEACRSLSLAMAHTKQIKNQDHAWKIWYLWKN